MKTKIISWIEKGCDFETGRTLFCELSNNTHFKRVLMLDKDRKYLEKVLYTELLTLAQISKSEAKKYSPQQIVPDTPQINKVQLDEHLITEEPKTKFKKTAREMYPNIDWNNDKRIDLVYILFGKQITSYHNFVEAHTQLRKSTSTEEVIKYTKIVVENVKDNKMLISELNNYNNTGDFLYQHPYFDEIKLITDLKALSPLQLSERLANLKTYISRYENNIAKKTEDKNRGKWEKLLISYKREMELINDLLDA